MSADLFLSVSKLTGAGVVRAAAMHNRRAIAAELGADSHIDAARCGLNVSLAGPDTPQAVAELAQSLMDAAGVGKLRSTAVRCIEVVFSLHPDSPITDETAYFNACTEWAGATFGPILTSDIHNDEGAPHAHVLCLPLRNGRMQGSDIVGGKAQFAAMIEAFFSTVAKSFGLRLPAKLSGTAKRAAADAVLLHLDRTGDAATDSRAWNAIRQCVQGNPAPFLAALGIAAPATAKPARSLVEIMTSRGAGARTHAEADRRDRALMTANPIGEGQFDAPTDAEMHAADVPQQAPESVPGKVFPYLCVGEGFREPSQRSKPAPARQGDAEALKAMPKPDSTPKTPPSAKQQGVTHDDISTPKSCSRRDSGAAENSRSRTRFTRMARRRCSHPEQPATICPSAWPAAGRFSCASRRPLTRKDDCHTSPWCAPLSRPVGDPPRRRTAGNGATSRRRFRAPEAGRSPAPANRRTHWPGHGRVSGDHQAAQVSTPKFTFYQEQQNARNYRRPD